MPAYRELERIEVDGMGGKGPPMTLYDYACKHKVPLGSCRLEQRADLGPSTFVILTRKLDYATPVLSRPHERLTDLVLTIELDRLTPA